MDIACKSCGEKIEVNGNAKVVVCGFCGMQQTVPQVNSEEKLSLFVDANAQRRLCKFDIAIEKYKNIIKQFPDDNEAYWCKLLCEYGIEYVEDILTEKNLPTCHRTIKESIFDNKDYRLIMSRATEEEKAIYEEEAKEIDRIQKEVIAKAEKEEPYDIFICYKETDENGMRTKDSQIATRIYANLTNKGYKVFFARVTLKELAGSKYEPIIYSALTSAKVLLLVSTSLSNINSPWVRNEWSRYLEFMNGDTSKVVVPCISNMDAYSLPPELVDFQALNTADMDFTENLTRQIDSKFNKNVQESKNPTQTEKQEATTQNVSNVNVIATYLKRIDIFLEDAEWGKADEYCERILDIDPECGEVYLKKACIDFKVTSFDSLIKKDNWFDNNNYKRAKRYLNGKDLEYCDKAEKEIFYQYALGYCKLDLLVDANYSKAKKALSDLGDYKDSRQLLENLSKEKQYQQENYERYLDKCQRIKTEIAEKLKCKKSNKVPGVTILLFCVGILFFVMGIGFIGNAGLSFMFVLFGVVLAVIAVLLGFAGVCEDDGFDLMLKEEIKKNTPPYDKDTKY